MLKRLAVRRTLMGLAGAGLFGAGVAGAPVIAAAFGGSTSDLRAVHMRRILGGGGTVACAGECLVVTAEADDSRTCPLRPGPQASYAACLTTLNGLCSTSCKSNPTAP